jgi:hypothetical protein
LTFSVAIFLPITFVGAGADPEVVDRMINAIERTWSGQFGNYSVITQVTYGRENLAWISEGEGRASVWLFARGGTHGSWFSEDSPWTTAHEAGHMMGLEDWYSDDPQGYKSPGIMSKRGEPPSATDIFAILNSPRNDVHVW